MEQNYMHIITLQDVGNKVYDEAAQDLANEIVLWEKQDEETQHMVYYPIRTRAFIIMVCIHGEAEVLINLNSCRIIKNQMICIFPEQVFQMRNISKDFNIKAILVSSSFLGKISDLQLLPMFKNILEHPTLTFSKQQWEIFLSYYSSLQKRINTKIPYQKQIVQHILSGLIFEIASMYKQILEHLPEEKTTRPKKLFFDFLQLLHNHFIEERSVRFYANRLAVTPQYLSTVVKEISGRTAGEWIDRAVILEAKVLLKSGQFSIKEITAKLHFANQSFFGKYFKHHVGISPKVYRQL